MAGFEYPIACLQGAWSFILGSLRLILFAAALLYFAVHMCIFSALVFMDKNLLSKDLQGHIGFFDYMLVLALVFVAGLGVYGSFYKHINSTRAFAVISSLIGLFFLLNAAVPSEPSTELDQLFNNSIRDYNWFARPNVAIGPEPNQTNTYVDGFQLMGCCGYESPKDWDERRPTSKEIQPESLPISCCATVAPVTYSNQCYKYSPEARLRPGCKKFLTAIYNVSKVSLIFYGLYQMFMALVAFIVSFCNLVGFEQASSRVAHNNSYACNNIIIESGPPRHSNGSSSYTPTNQAPISTISRSESKIGLVQASGNLMCSERPSTSTPPPKYPDLL